MNAQTPQTTWQSIGDLVAALAQEKARQRANAPGNDHNPKSGETGMDFDKLSTGKAGAQ